MIPWRSLRKFFNRILIKRSNQCWEWQGTKNGDGYGHMSVKGVLVQASHIAWMIHTGKPIPHGKKVLHSCDNPPCCNPKHLFLGTQKQNMEDMARKGRARGPATRPNINRGLHAGTNNANCKLTEAEVRTVRRRLARGDARKDIAKDLSISLSSVDRILNGTQWGCLT